jgi:hypothetical protein
MVRIVVILLLLLIIAAMVCSAKEETAPSQRITGTVTDINSNPVIGASVVFYAEGKRLSGCPTDSQGIYVRKFTALSYDSLIVKVSSIGFESETVVVFMNRSNEVVSVDFQLKQKPIEVGAIKVKPKDEHPRSVISLRHEQIVAAAAQSLIPTNLTSVIKQPQVVREGSNHSSKIIVNGTRPKYYINGIEIGSNPNHYGVFSIIPAPVVEEMTFQPHGTGSQLGSTSAVELSTGHAFEKHSRGEISLSLIEATGAFSFGSSRYFILGSLRKSVLDKLVKQFDIRSGRRTLPPTNFQDIFVSSGLKFSDQHHLLVDQYHVRDFLSYSTGATSNNPNGIMTFLHTEEHYLGVRWCTVYDKMLLKIGAAVRSTHEEYAAASAAVRQTEGVKLDLKADRQANSGNIEMILPIDNGLFTIGNQLEYVSRGDIDMIQYNWNFLPPDANSDNPFTYQAELNHLYGTYTGSRPELNNAAYVSLNQSFEDFRFEIGLRGEYFGDLDGGTVLLLRNRAIFNIGETGKMSFFLGSFARHPVDKILEPYQVLIHANFSDQKPIMTKLLSADYSVGNIKLGLFAKQIDNLPVPMADFAHANADGSVEDGFLSMQSSGQLAFCGGDVTLELDSLLSPRIDLYTFYGYTYGEKIVSGLTIPYELNSPHKLFVRTTYRLSRVVSIAGEAALRSGFSYTPTRSATIYHDEDRLSEQYYKSGLSAENRAQFPLNATLNVHVNFDFGRSHLFFSVANLTNHSNPIINTSDGFIYDTSILPSIGFRWRF